MTTIPQGSILGLVHFNPYINDMDSGIECKFADDAKLSRGVHMFEGRDV